MRDVRSEIYTNIYLCDSENQWGEPEKELGSTAKSGVQTAVSGVRTAVSATSARYWPEIENGIFLN